MSNLSIIPARAGSKGIVNKNVKPFLGKPLFIWSVLSALEHKNSTVIISSNCPLVKLAFESFDRKDECIFIHRPEELSTDKSRTEDCMIHAVDVVGSSFETISLFQPTSPVRVKGMINMAFDLLSESKKSSLMSVSCHTPFFVQDTDPVKWLYNPFQRKMRQDIPNEELYYHDDGCLYINSMKSFKENKCRIDTESVVLYKNDKVSSMQIDCDVDWDVLEMYAEKSQSPEYILTKSPK